MDRRSELLAEVIWRIGTRVQTGWWFAPLGRILDALDTLNEGQVVEICEQSRPAHDREEQEIVFKLHKGQHQETKTWEERRDWTVVILTAFRMDWATFLQ